MLNTSPSSPSPAAQTATIDRILLVVECAVAIALITICAQLTVPLGFLKFTMQVFAVMLVALIFKPGPAFAAMACYILLGAVGVPVFSWAGEPGIGRLIGPFGGYLFSYVAAAPIGSLVRRAICPPERRAGNLKRSLLADIVAVVVVALLIYAIETVYFVAIGAPSAPSNSVMGVLMFTTIPYIPAEAVKGVLAVLVAQALRRAIPRFAQR